MVRVEVLAVGRELLIGRTVNTNGYWVGRRLARMGSMVARMAIVDDDLGEISSALNEILGRSPDFVISMGGLGPTPDDMTLKGIARALGVGLRLNERALEMIRERYTKLGRELELTPQRKKMAMLPERATPIRNEEGTAPGVRLKSGKTVIFCLPGVPREMKSMFRSSVEPEIRARVGKLYRKTVRLSIEGIYESALAPIIEEELSRYPSAYIKSHPKGVRRGVSRIELDIVFVNEKRSEAEKLAAAAAKEIIGRVEAEGGVVKAAAGGRRDV